MSDFVQFFESRHLKNLERSIRREMVDEALEDALGVLHNFVRASYRFRAFRTGAAMRSGEEKFEREQFKGTATLFMNRLYNPFLEWGTGRRGAASGVTPPPGYVYGPRPGMAARQPAALALKAATPTIIEVFERHARKLSADAQ